MRQGNVVADILALEGMAPSDVDRFVVDRWWTQGAGNTSAIQSRSRDRTLELPVAPYVDGPGAEGPMRRYVFQDYDSSSFVSGYVSYYHISNHLLGAYCSSPFATRGEDALVLVWDGGTVPRLYHVEARTRTVTAVSSLLPITGNSFALFSSQFDPFRRDINGLSTEEVLRYHLSLAEKAMAYAALGRVEESVFPILDDIITDFLAISPYDAQALAEKIAVNRDEMVPGSGAREPEHPCARDGPRYEGSAQRHQGSGQVPAGSPCLSHLTRRGGLHARHQRALHALRAPPAAGMG